MSHKEDVNREEGSGRAGGRWERGGDSYGDLSVLKSGSLGVQ